MYQRFSVEPQGDEDAYPDVQEAEAEGHPHQRPPKPLRSAALLYLVGATLAQDQGYVGEHNHHHGQDR